MAKYLGAAVVLAAILCVGTPAAAQTGYGDTYTGYGTGAQAPVSGEHHVAGERSVRSWAGLALYITGWTFFGLTYLGVVCNSIAVTARGEADDRWPLYIPIAGPFVQTGINGNSVFILFGLLEVIGITCAIWGHIWSAQRSREFRNWASSPRRRARIAVLPAATRRSLSLVISALL